MYCQLEQSNSSILVEEYIPRGIHLLVDGNSKKRSVLSFQWSSYKLIRKFQHGPENFTTMERSSNGLYRVILPPSIIFY